MPRVCSACGAASAWDARFCQQCGRPLDEGAPRYHGVLAPGPAFALGCVLLAAAVLALIAGSLLGAIVFLAVAVGAFVFFWDAARRHPDDRVARGVSTSGHHVLGWSRFALTSIGAWGHAGRDLFRLRRESRSLRREREPMLRSLGEAVYQEDESLAETLRQRIREIDGELAKREEARVEALAAARHRVDEERDAATSTQQLSVEDIERSGDEPDR